MILEGAEFVKHDGIIEKQISEEGRTHSDLFLSYFNAILNPNTHTKKHLTQTHSKHKYTNTLVYILSFCNFNLSGAEA